MMTDAKAPEAPGTGSIPAATLILLRERGGEEGATTPEMLMVERSQKMAFAAGAMVFPGGRIDADDNLLATEIAPHIEDAAARIAAIRETIEESGLPVGLSRSLGQMELIEMRERLHGGEPFSILLRQAEVGLDLLALTPFARWRPNFKEARTFDTRFYLARAPEPERDGVVDSTENVSLIWTTAANMLTATARGEGHVIFPTRRNLERLAQFDSIDALVAHAGVTPVDMVTPWIEERDGERHLCIPEHLGYPVTSERMDTAMRG